MSAFWDITVLFAVSFVPRLLHLLGKKTSDDYSHKWMILERVRHGDLRQHTVERSVITGYRGYPPLSHWIVGLFPESHWLLVGRILNIVYDCVSILLYYGVIVAICKGLWHLDVRKFGVPFMSAVVYGSLPIFFPVTARLRAVSARTLGGLFCNLLMVGYAIGWLYSSPWAYGVCAILVLLIIISSQFAMQYTVLMCLLLSAIQRTPWPVLILLSGVLLSLLPMFDGRKLLYRKLMHFRWYIRYLMKNKNDEFGVQARNRLRKFIQLPIDLFRHPRDAMRTIFLYNSYIILAYSLPVLWFLAYFGFVLNREILPLVLDEGVCQLAVLLVGVAGIGFLIASQRPFLLLGQAERYFEYGAFPLMLVATCVFVHARVDTAQVFFVLFSVNTVVISLLRLYLSGDEIVNEVSSGMLPDLCALIGFLKQREKQMDMRVITLPTKFAFQVSLFLGAKTRFYYDNVCVEGEGMQYMLDEHTRLHFFRAEFNFFQEKYGINTFVFDRSALAGSRQIGIEYNLNRLREVFQNDSFIVCAPRECSNEQDQP